MTTVTAPCQENGDRHNLTEVSALNNAIVHMPGKEDKIPRAQIIALLRRAGAPVEAHRDAIESSPDDDPFAGLDLIDDPLVDFLTPTQISAYYRGQMHLFEPVPAAEITRVEPIREARGWRAAVTTGRRSPRPVDSNRPTSSCDPRLDGGTASGPSIEGA
jgi:hypothetical protein